MYHLLRHETERIKGLASGAAAPIINKSAFSKIIVVVPPLPTQRKIAAILSAYDDLIENNTRRIQLLEESAQLLYREWFVRFRFPGHERVRMVESDLGLIPEGWDIRTLEQFGSIVTGKTPSKAIPEYYGDYMPFIKIPDMHGRIFCTEAGEYLSLSGVLSQQNKTLPPNSICVSCIGSAGLVAITTAYSQTNQQINSIIVDNDSDREFLYFTLVGLRDTINLYGANGVTMVNLNRSKFANLRTLYPTLTLVTQFHQMTQPLFEQILVLQRTNTLLRTTRDLLLPRLISGEVDVTELEIVI